MAQSLAVRYRPKTFNEVLSQKSVIQILERQLAIKQISHAYLFCGPSGTGKTTLACALARRINNNKGFPIEIDAASNSGVENVRQIIEDAKQRSIESEYKIFIIDECVTGETEILTDHGFKRIDSLDHTELIAQYTKTGEIEFVKPLDYITQDYTGNMYKVSLRNGKCSVLMSPNHVQPLLMAKTHTIKEQYIKDCKFAQSNKLIVSGFNKTSDNSSLTALDKLAIASQADGYMYTERKNPNADNYWIVGLSKKEKIDNLLKYFDEANIQYKELKSRNNGHIRRFAYHLPKTITKKLTSYFKIEMGQSRAQEIIAEIMKWDGSYKSGYDGFYSSKIKENSDFVAAVALQCGYSTHSVTVDDHNEKHAPLYTVRLTKTCYRTGQSCRKDLIENYTGKIYCVKVPSQMFVARAEGFTFITGNCHSLSSQAWQAFLKTIEEPPEYTIFMFCTTNPEKVPETIQNRCMRFNITKVNTALICDRLKYICAQEQYSNYDEACEYISKISNGGVRDAISMLEKCASYNPDLRIENVLECLGVFSYDIMFDLTGALLNTDESFILNTLDSYYDAGVDLTLFVDQYLDFTLDLLKYCLFRNMSNIKIPSILENRCNGFASIPQCADITGKLVDNVLEIKNMIKRDSNPKLTIEAMFIRISREILS